MFPSKPGSGKDSSNCESESAWQTEGAAQFLSSTSKLTSLLEFNWVRGRSLEDTINTWQKLEINAQLRLYQHVIHTRLPWWSYLLNPIWTLIFVVKRKVATADPKSVRREQWEYLDYLLGRAEFVFPLSSETRRFLRRSIEKGKISRRRAMALVRSFGCRISKAGEISASPIGAIRLNAGKLVTTASAILFSLFSLTLADELMSPCGRHCVTAGSIEIMIFLIYLASLSRSLSTERNRQAHILEELQRHVTEHGELLG